MDIKDRLKIKRDLIPWKLGAIHAKLWSGEAQYGTIVIQTGEQGARAVVADEYGIREAFKVPPGQIGEIISAAAQAWIERGGKGSLAVYAQSDEVALGILRPPPPPPPGPGGHERIFLLQNQAVHTMGQAAVELLEHDEVGQLRVHAEMEVLTHR
jgi:hypothetical protein